MHVRFAQNPMVYSLLPLAHGLSSWTPKLLSCATHLTAFPGIALRDLSACHRLRNQGTALTIRIRSLLWTTRSSRIHPRLFVIPIESAGAARTGSSYGRSSSKRLCVLGTVPLEIPVDV